jgi:predicted nucleic acid-binding protein
MATLFARDAQVVASWTSSVEIWAAIARRRRAGSLGSPDVRSARERLRTLRDDWAEVDDVEAIRIRAIRLVEVHALRAADAMQLAAALVAVQDRPDEFPFVTLDDQLAAIAEAEGFRVQPGGTSSPSGIRSPLPSAHRRRRGMSPCAEA